MESACREQEVLLLSVALWTPGFCWITQRLPFNTKPKTRLHRIRFGRWERMKRHAWLLPVMMQTRDRPHPPRSDLIGWLSEAVMSAVNFDGLCLRKHEISSTLPTDSALYFFFFLSASSYVLFVVHYCASAEGCYYLLSCCVSLLINRIRIQDDPRLWPWICCCVKWMKFWK